MLRVAKLQLHARTLAMSGADLGLLSTSGAGTARLAVRPQQRNPATGAAGESMSGADTASGSRSSAAAAAWSCEGASHGKSSHAGGATPDSLEPPPSLLDAPPGEDLCDVWVKEEQKIQKREDLEKKKRKTREEDLLASLEAHKKRRELSPESSARNSSSGSSSGTPTSPRHWEAQTMQHTKNKEKQDFDDEEWVERELWLLQKTSGICVDRCFSVRPRPGEDTTIFFRDRRSEFRKTYEDLSLRKWFYIGIAANPQHRWDNAIFGHAFTFDTMHLLAFGCSTTIGDFEDFLIKHAWLHHGQRCLNQQVGRCGQGTREQNSYLYICTREKQPEDDEVDQCNDNASTVRKQFLKKQEHWASIIDSMYDR
jgi:hypothetical protein